MTAAHAPNTYWPVIRCDGPDCNAETGHPEALTATDVRRLRRDWHQRPGGRDICPDCWKADRR
ncbi:hypothetical protein ABZ135_38765 [Streptomyces sp. NPDC006339]|uniref:hypothetical protein n=1 Tax=Streptomyces sp. NPDC006339 TaxID=3156755 RepID=UPI0033B536B7